MTLKSIQLIVMVAIFAMFIAFFMRGVVYKYTGWKTFTMEKFQNFQVVDNDITKVGKLKFDNCILTLNSGPKGDITKTFTVTYALNTMAGAYKKTSKKGYTFKLSDPGLSIYTFTLPSFNDATVKPDPDIWSDNTAILKLTGKYKILE